MQEEVRSHPHTRLFGSRRLPSFAGNGLPERMRSTAFAFLGLTAAAGLALVAIFAQLSFPLLTPAPLPSEPAVQSRVAEAVALDHGARGLVPARPGEEVPAPQKWDGGGDRGGPAPSSAPDGSTTGTATPAPVPSPGADGNGAPEPAHVPSPDPAQSSSPAQDPESASPPRVVPVDSPASPAAPPRPAPSAPEPVTAPGNSQSAAAAEHAGERGIEASSKSSPAAPAPEATPGNGNGKALGQSK
jgi:hypothetical protein